MLSVASKVLEVFFWVAWCQFYPSFTVKRSYPSHDCTKGTLSPPPTELTCEKLLDVTFIFSPLPRQMTCEISVKCILYFFLVFSLYLFINWCPTLKARDLCFVYLHYCLGIYSHSTWLSVHNLKLLSYLHVYSSCSCQRMESTAAGLVGQSPSLIFCHGQNTPL